MTQNNVSSETQNNYIFKYIYIASDHAGLQLKDFLVKHLMQQLNLRFNKVIDLGPLVGSTEATRCDYPDFAHKVCTHIKTDTDAGILICGSGVGMSITANRHPHIRAALAHNKHLAGLSRQHNNANVLCLGQQFVAPDDALNMAQIFLTTTFDGGRHSVRLAKLNLQNI